MCRALGERLRPGDLVSLLSRLVGFILSVGVQFAVSDIKFRPRSAWFCPCLPVHSPLCVSVRRFAWLTPNTQTPPRPPAPAQPLRAERPPETSTRKLSKPVKELAESDAKSRSP